MRWKLCCGFRLDLDLQDQESQQKQSFGVFRGMRLGRFNQAGEMYLEADISLSWARVLD